MYFQTEDNYLNILLVEDSPTQAEQLRYILEKRNFRVTLAGNGKQALEILREFRPNVVITDVVMPEMDGYELCRTIRSREKLKDIPVILVTTLSDPTDVIRGLEVGANNFITKPYDERYLVSRLQYLITNMELRKDLTAEMGINVYFSGKNYFITAERLQILDLLLSTYENAYHQNCELLNAQKKLQELNEHLEDIVRARTAELLSANAQLKIELQERLRAEEEKTKLQAQLHQAQRMESVGRLAGGVAHDYNNMLSVILGYAQMALDKVEPDSTLSEDLREILSAAERSTRITRQLLTFARKQTIVPQVLDLNETVQGMINMLKRLIGEDITLNWRPGAQLQPVKIDPSQMDQLLANLCVNARDAIVGVGMIDIETSMATIRPEDCADNAELVVGDYVVISVGDTGCGMEKDVQEKIFEPFFTTKAVGHGTGLGLSTVYGIVHQHNGFINVVSAPGRGTTFKIFLPTQHSEITTKEGTGNGVTQRGQGQTVLIVEDDEAILKLTGQMLRNLGYSVLSANSPGKALSIARENLQSIDLLLTDVIMPEMNGRDLAELLAAIHPEIKCLFMSGYSSNIIDGQGMLGKGLHLIAKPFTAKKLAAKVHELLDSKAAPPAATYN